MVIQSCFHEASTNLSIKGFDLWAHTHTHTHTPHTYLHSHLPGHIKYAWLYFMRLEEAKVTQPATGRADGAWMQGQCDKVAALKGTPWTSRATTGTQHPLCAQASSPLPPPQCPGGHSSDPAGAIIPLALPGSLSESLSSLNEELCLPLIALQGPARFFCHLWSGSTLEYRFGKGLPL